MEARTRGISQTIKDQKTKAKIKAGYIDLGIKALAIVIVAYLMLSQVFIITQARGMEMFPAVKDGDLIIGFRLYRHYEKNDLVVYKIDGKRRIGRIVARSKDVVTIEEEGTLRVNGTLQSGEIMYPTYPKENLSYPYNVEENHMFVLGDYRTQAQDSRDLGSIPLDKIEGKIITILRRQGL